MMRLRLFTLLLITAGTVYCVDSYTPAPSPLNEIRSPAVELRELEQRIIATERRAALLERHLENIEREIVTRDAAQVIDV